MSFGYRSLGARSPKRPEYVTDMQYIYFGSDTESEADSETESETDSETESETDSGSDSDVDFL